MGYYTDFNGGLKILPPITDEALIELINGTDKGEEGARQQMRERFGGLPVRAPYEFDVVAGRLEPYQTWNSWTVGTLTIHDANSGSLHDEQALVIEESGKHYFWEEWLYYLAFKVLNPLGHYLEGSVEWDGEDGGDIGEIIAGVVDGKQIITTSMGRIVYTDHQPLGEPLYEKLP